MINLHDPEFPPLKRAIMLRAPNHLRTQPPQSQTAHVYQTWTRRIMLKDQWYDPLEHVIISEWMPLLLASTTKIPYREVIKVLNKIKMWAFLPSSKPQWILETFSPVANHNTTPSSKRKLLCLAFQPPHLLFSSSAPLAPSSKHLQPHKKQQNKNQAYPKNFISK